MRMFNITWYNKDAGSGSTRTNKVSISKETGDIGTDAHAALNILSSRFGNLNKIEIVSIQEIDNSGNNLGEPIVPMEDTSIVPTKK